MATAYARFPSSARGAPVARPRRATGIWRILPAVIVCYSFLLPRELDFQIGELDLQPYRVAMVLMLPVVLFQAVRQPIKPSFVDLLIVLAMIWMVTALSITGGYPTGFVFALTDAVNMGLAYLIGRVAVRNALDFKRFFLAIMPSLFIMAVVMATESFLRVSFYRPFFGSLTGYNAPDLLGGPLDEIRLGLMRASGPFGHPILAGTYLSSFTAIAWYLAQKPSHRVFALLAVAGFFFALSSTGYLGFMVLFALLLTNYVHRASKLPVFPVMIGGALFAMIFIEIFSNGGVFRWIVRNLTLDPGTGYFRLLIWEYGLADLNRHPIFGIGFRTYERPPWMYTGSVDAHILVIGLRYGWPAVIFTTAAALWAAAVALRGAWSPYPLDQRVAYSICYTLIAISVCGLAVHLYESMYIWLNMLTGMGISFGHMMREAVRSSQVDRAYRPKRRAA